MKGAIIVNTGQHLGLAAQVSRIRSIAVEALK